MKQDSTYQLFLKTLVFVLLIGQVWTNAVSYSCWVVDCEIELAEKSGAEDNESEEEENKKEKDHKIRMNALAAKVFDLDSISSLLGNEDLFSFHHTEISTPPPEYIFTHS